MIELSVGGVVIIDDYGFTVDVRRQWTILYGARSFSQFELIAGADAAIAHFQINGFACAEINLSRRHD